MTSAWLLAAAIAAAGPVAGPSAPLLPLAPGVTPAAARGKPARRVVRRPAPRPLTAAELAADAAAMTRPMAFAALGATVDLQIQPGARRLAGKARWRFKSPGAGLVRMQLHPGLAATRATLDDKPVKWTRTGDRLEIACPRVRVAPGRAAGASVLAVEFAGRPLVEGRELAVQDVGPAAAFLHPDGRFFPRPEAGGACAITVSVKAPPGWRAVGPAQRASAERAANATRLDFAAGAPVAVAVAPYRAFNAGGATFWAFATGAGAAGAPADLADAARMVALLKGHGIQLGGKAGTTLVELPPGLAGFAVPGWSAAPRPAGEAGEWLAALAWSPADAAVALRPERPWLVESLAAYCADVAGEKAGGPRSRQAAAQAHRAAYQAFLDRTPALDRPLDQPIAMDQPAWGPVVRDKGALVWGMLRDALGEDAFWALLRRWQGELRAGGGTWPEFEALAGRRGDWLDAWLRQPGLPHVGLEDVHVAEADGRWQVTGVVAQHGPFFGLPIDVGVVSETGAERIAFSAFAPRVPFHFVTTSKPLRVVLDGAERAAVRKRDHMRIPEGIAPAGAVIVYGTHGDAPDNAASQQAAEAMRERLKRFKGLELAVKADRELTPAERAGALILMGRPGVNDVATALADQFPVRFIRGEAPAEGGAAAEPVDGKALWWQGRTYTQAACGVVEIVANPEAPERPVVLFAGLSPAAQLDALRFSQQPETFCVFQGDGVVEEGTALRAFPDLDAVLY